MSEAERIREEMLMVRAGWPEALDRILAGFSHDLNGRVTALRGVLELASLGEELQPLDDFLRGEVERLETLARTLWALPEGGGEPETMAPGPFLSEVLLLHEKHRGLEGIGTTLQLDVEAPAFLAARRRVRRALLLALAEVARSASSRGGRRVTVACGPAGPGVDDGLLLVLSPGPGAPLEAQPRPGSARVASEDGLAALAELFALDRVRLRSAAGAAGLVLRLEFPAA